MNEADHIKAFWEWFTKNVQHIRDVLDNEQAEEQESLIESINNHVLAIGAFAWEIGPGTSKPWSLTISPNGDRDLLELSRKIMRKAPGLNDWEFNHSKPMKDWDMKFDIYDDYMNELKVDARKWNCVLQKHPDNRIEVILHANNVDHLDDNTRLTAADLVVTNMLGEEQKIQHVRSVEIVAELETVSVEKSSPLSTIKQHFDELISNPD